MQRVGLFVVVLSLLAILCIVPECTGAKDSTTSTGTQTESPNILRQGYEWAKGLPVNVILRAGALKVAILAILFWDRRADTWINAQVLLAGVGGAAAYFAPNACGTIVGNTGPVHDYLLQVLGCLMIAQAYCFSRFSSDGATRFLLFLGQAVGGLMSLELHLFGHFKYASDDIRFGDEHLTLEISATALVALGGLVFLYRHTASSGGAEVISVGGINTHLLIDALFACLIGLLALAFPEVTLGVIKDVKPDGIMGTVVRQVGLYYLVSGFWNILFCSNSNENDKKVRLLERILSTALYLPLATLYQLKFGFVSWPVFAAGITSCLVLPLNAVCALYIRDRRKKRV